MARPLQLGSSNDVPRPRAECFILCDFAQEENGKLYIVGGGWDHIAPRHLPLAYDAYLAVKLVLPSGLFADPVLVRIELADANDHLLGDPVLERVIEGGAIGLEEEDEHGLRFVVNMFMGPAVRMELAAPGKFTLRLLVNDELIASTSFTVASALVPSEG